MLDTTTTITTTTAEPVTMAPLVALPTLPEAINAAHVAVRGAGKTMLLEAKKAGDLLLQAKEQCAHGEFKTWIEKNCAFPYRTAARYMQLAKSVASDTFDLDATIDSILDTHAHRRNAPHPTEEADEPVTTALTAISEPKPTKPSTSVKELKAEVSALQTEIARLAGELQAAHGALATAEAHIETLKGGDTVVVSTVFTAEVADLRQEIADLTEMLNDADKDKAALREEVKDLQRKLKLATNASPAAARALRPKDLDENGLDMNDARNW